MTEFSNNTIDTLQLPQYQHAELNPIHPLYMKVVWANLGLTFGGIAVAAGALFYSVEELTQYWGYATIAYAVLLVVSMLVQLINYRNKGYAFREHDVIYRSGAISVTTTIIPYNRIQHVAEHEGVVSRWLGLSSIGVFTAGGTGSDIVIPGLEKVHAAAVKQLIANKIDKSNGDKQDVADLYTRAVNAAEDDNTDSHAHEA